MKLETYKKYCEEFDDFSQFNKEVDPSIFIKQLENSKNQVRAFDLMMANVPVMRTSITKNGQQAPVTISYDAYDDPVIEDGFTRAKACLDENRLLLVNDYAYQKLGWTDDEWFDFRCQENDHLPQVANSNADIKRQVMERVQSGYFNRLVGFTYDTNPEKWMDDACKKMLETYSNSSLKKDSYFRWIGKGQLQKPSGKVKPYDEKEAMQFVTSHSNQLPFKWTGTKVGQVTHGNTVYFATDRTNVTKSILGYAFEKTGRDKPVNVHVMVYLSQKSAAGKNPAAIKKERQWYRDEFAKLNSHSLLKGRLIATVHFLPQLRTQENMYQFIK